MWHVNGRILGKDEIFRIVIIESSLFCLLFIIRAVGGTQTYSVFHMFDGVIRVRLKIFSIKRLRFSPN